MKASSRYLLALSATFACGNAFPRQPRAAACKQPAPGACKAAPGTPEWPSSDIWTQFNQTTGGKLLRPTPPGAVCHPGMPTYNSDHCTDIAKAWLTYDFSQDDPVSNMWQQYNNDTCLPIPNTPCSPDGYPAYVVNATSAQDVKLSLDFAREHNVRVIVKSTGHDYQGRSQAPGALSIWVHYMQGLTTHESFKPKGCNFTIDHTAVTAAAGSQLAHVYEELGKIGQIVVGGNSRSVSVGGYITGGGHSVLTPRYGLAADQVLEMEVVTPMGDIVVANECQNEDLFWAMRGGGGSTFGVMTAVTLATHPSPKVVGADISILTPNTNASYVWDMAGYILSQFPYLDSKGISGYSIITDNFSYPGFPVSGAGAGGFFILQDTEDVNDMLNIWAPIIEHVNKTWPDMVPVVSTKAYPLLQDWFKIHYDRGSAGGDFWLGSHLMDAESLTDPAALGEAFKIFGGSAYLVAGKGARDAKPRGGSNSVNPSWRKALVHAVNGVQFQPLNQTAKMEALAKVQEKTEPLRKLAPDMGAYVNENNPGEPNWQRTYWGDNYDRLLQIKRTVDPLDVLWCNPCVGNDRWKEDGYKLCRVE